MEQTTHHSAPDTNTSSGYVDTAALGLEAHLLIKDADDDTALVNQRG